jgi:glycosyltransferase involved in cell wall biosynthesis
MFDLDSGFDRKNPLAAVEAFRRAFPAEGAAALLVKAGHADGRREDYARLEERVRGIPGVYLTDRMLTRKRVNGLMAACDAAVSLHRSEGFGLVLAESMLLGKVVVATGWSGNMEFMNTGNSCPVGYELVSRNGTHPAAEGTQYWAEPDLEHAAHLMRRVVDDASFRTRIAGHARATIESRFSPETAGLRYRRRLAFLDLMEPMASTSPAMSVTP